MLVRNLSLLCCSSTLAVDGCVNRPCCHPAQSTFFQGVGTHQANHFLCTWCWTASCRRIMEMAFRIVEPSRAVTGLISWWSKLNRRCIWMVSHQYGHACVQSSANSVQRKGNMDKNICTCYGASARWLHLWWHPHLAAQLALNSHICRCRWLLL